VRQQWKQVLMVRFGHWRNQFAKGMKDARQERFEKIFANMFQQLGKERRSTRVMKRDLPKQYRDLNLNHPGKVFAKYFMGHGPTPHSLTMQIGMPLENIIELMKGQRSFTPAIVLVLEQCFCPPVRSLVDLQVIYDLEERVFFLKVFLATLPVLKNVKKEHVLTIKRRRADLRLALAKVKPVLKMAKKKRVLIMRRIRAARRLRR
jgi:plasmid maintenance system antidote protein VapI